MDIATSIDLLCRKSKLGFYLEITNNTKFTKNDLAYSLREMLMADLITTEEYYKLGKTLLHLKRDVKNDTH